MDYHLKLFDSDRGVKWIKSHNGHNEISTKHPGDLKQKLAGRAPADFLHIITEIDRRIVRYDKGDGLPAYYIRLAEVSSITNPFYLFFFWFKKATDTVAATINDWNIVFRKYKM